MSHYDNGCYVEFFAVKDGVRYNSNVVPLRDLMMELTNGHIKLMEDVFADMAVKEVSDDNS